MLDLGLQTKMGLPLYHLKGRFSIYLKIENEKKINYINLVWECIIYECYYYVIYSAIKCGHI